MFCNTIVLRKNIKVLQGTLGTDLHIELKSNIHMIIIWFTRLISKSDTFIVWSKYALTYDLGCFDKIVPVVLPSSVCTIDPVQIY